jgi:signal transduction histidine kinase
MRLGFAVATVVVMRDRIPSLVRHPRALLWADAILGVLLGATAVLPVLGGQPQFGPPGPIAVALALLSTVPVAWRSIYPIPAATVLLVAKGLALAAAAPHEGALQPFVALVLAGYSVGSRAEGRYAVVIPAVLAIAAVPVFVLALATGQELGNEVTSYIWLIATWGGGRVVRSMRRTADELARANDELAQQRDVAARAAVTVERGRIARELHDVIAHNVSMMVVQAGAAARVLRADEPEVRAALDTIAVTGRQTVDEMRSLLGVLRSVDDGSAGTPAEVAAKLAPQPGLAELPALVDSVQRAGLSVTCRVEGRPQPLPAALDLSAYRVVQEALTNALRHAPGAHATVVVGFADADLSLQVRDKGGDRSVSSPGPGHGLVGMRERVAMFGGDFTAGPTSDGFRVSATFPIPVVADA